MASKGVCNDCNTVYLWQNKHVQLRDTKCPNCGQPLDNYDMLESWKLEHVTLNPDSITEEPIKADEPNYLWSKRKGVLDH